MDSLNLNVFERLVLKLRSGLSVKRVGPRDLAEKVKMLDQHAVFFDQMSEGKISLDRIRVLNDLHFFNSCIEHAEQFLEHEDDVWNVSLSLVCAIASATRAFGGSYKLAFEKARQELQASVRNISRWESKYVISSPSALPIRAVTSSV